MLKTSSLILSLVSSVCILFGAPAVAWAVEQASPASVLSQETFLDSSKVDGCIDETSTKPSVEPSSEQGTQASSSSSSSSSAGSSTSSSSQSTQGKPTKPAQTTPATPKYPVGWSKDAKGIWHYGNKDGSARTGWLLLGKTWYYLDPANAGAMKTGWYQDTSKRWFYSNSSGAMLAKRWIKTGNTWYYVMSNGARQTGWLSLGVATYYLNPAQAGAMVVGDFKVSNVSYRADASGALVKNAWVSMGGNKLAFAGSNGALNSGAERTSDGKIIIKDSSGKIRTGWINFGGYRFFADPSKGGRLATGWTTSNGKKYYFDSNYAPHKGWLLLNGRWYYFDSDGAMATGWRKVGGSWFWLRSSDGVMLTGSQYVDNAWNYFYANGAWDATASYMMRRAQGISSNTGWLILVDTSACRTTVFSRSSNSWVVNQTWSCSPGAYGTPTKKGYFTVGSRGYYFDSGASRCFYWTQFSGNYLFHSVLYARTATPQYIRDGRLGMNLSHGCVRLDVNCAKWIYDRIPFGTRVYTY